MHIGLVVYGSLEQTSGGYRYDRKLVEYLRKQGDTVDVISLPQRTYPVDLFSGFSRSLQRRLNRPYDVLLQDELCHPTLWRVNHRLKRPRTIVSLVHLLRSGPPRRRTRRFVRQIERSYFQTVDATICTSANTKRRVQALADVPSLVAYPGGRTEGAALTQRDVQNRAHGNPLQILFVGTVSPRKETLTLVKALNGVEGAWNADIVGNLDAHPDYVDRVRSQIKRSGLSERITVRGPVSNDLLTRLLRRSHVLAVPSRYESFGMVYLEAMEYGVVPIASAVGGASEYIDDGRTGFLVDPGNSGQIQTILNLVQRNRKTLASLGGRALKRTEAHPTWQSSLSRIREFLHSINTVQPNEETLSSESQSSVVS